MNVIAAGDSSPTSGAFGVGESKKSGERCSVGAAVSRLLEDGAAQVKSQRRPLLPSCNCPRSVELWDCPTIFEGRSRYLDIVIEEGMSSRPMYSEGRATRFNGVAEMRSHAAEAELLQLELVPPLRPPCLAGSLSSWRGTD